ncbi:preprotein translocase subunit YajC [Taibaiella helva]|uniref:preprotein translocase subunit YajC n=1 Tax=Taibaiella helva TaxID=2301235 RepID=UPI000E590A04|nr:preprotein translocase subunit YajC [Taibaiella helva]
MTTTFASVMLQAQPGGGAMMPIMLVGMIVVMYFFMIRPQQKRAKEQKKFAESMGTGDKIITTSGIHGRIVRTNEDGTIVIEIDRNTNVTIERQAISMEMTQAYLKRTGQTSASSVATVK